MIGNGGFSGGGGFVSGVTDVFANLPDASSQTNKLYYVTTGSGGLLSIVGSYKHPKGLYFSDGVTWVLSQLQVQIAEDAQSLVNFTDWTTYLANGNVVKQWDVIIYSSKMYQNTTGTTTATAPDLDTTNFTELTFGGGGSVDFQPIVPAGAFNLPSTNFADLYTEVGTNVNTQTHIFPDSGNKRVWFQTVLPDSIGGTVVFNVYGFSDLAAGASKNTGWKIFYSMDNGTTWDIAESSLSSGALSVGATQDFPDKLSFSDTVANLGLVAGRTLIVALERDNTVADNVSGDYKVRFLKGVFPSS
jgi:hypothetical protein